MYKINLQGQVTTVRFTSVPSTHFTDKLIQLLKFIQWQWCTPTDTVVWFFPKNYKFFKTPMII